MVLARPQISIFSAEDSFSPFSVYVCVCLFIYFFLKETTQNSDLNNKRAAVNYCLKVISVYLSSLPVAHLSDAPRRRLVVTGDSARYRTKLLRILPGTLTCSAYSTVTRDLGLTSHPKDN